MSKAQRPPTLILLIIKELIKNPIQFSEKNRKSSNSGILIGEFG